MSGAKIIISNQEDLAYYAATILVEVGAAQFCEYHDELMLDDINEELLIEAYKLANLKVTKKDIVLPSGTRRKDLTDTIKRLYGDLPFECSWCEKHAAE